MSVNVCQCSKSRTPFNVTVIVVVEIVEKVVVVVVVVVGRKF